MAELRQKKKDDDAAALKGLEAAGPAIDDEGSAAYTAAAECGTCKVFMLGRALRISEMTDGIVRQMVPHGFVAAACVSLDFVIPKRPAGRFSLGEGLASVAIFRIDGTFFALDAACPHGGECSLDEGANEQTPDTSVVAPHPLPKTL